MASKLQTIIDYAQKLTVDLAEQRGVWQSYLLTAARVYKYPFPEQLLIYGQRPDAKACASFEFWNERMGRRVNKGAKGIALIDDSGERQRLKYIFDISDTHPIDDRSPKVRLWRMDAQYQDAVAEALANAFGSPDEAASFDDHIITVSRIAAQDNMADYLDELRNVRTDSFLEELDDLNLETRFRKLLGDSVAFTVLTRCGIDPYQYFDSEDFDTVFEFHTFDTMTVLGTATSDVSRILVATKKDFETKNRKRFCGRIATGDYDAIIIGHSQFEKIPMSAERQRALLEQQMDEIMAGIAELKENHRERFSIKQMERTKKSIQLKLDKLNDTSRKDDV